MKSATAFYYIAYMITKPVILLALVFLLSCCASSEYHNSLNLKKDPHFPKWLSFQGFNADQTSGIAFINETSGATKNFLLADDTGGILHLAIAGDTIRSLRPVKFSDAFQAYIDTFPKADFEEIVYDKKNNKVYLSIEGNGPHPAYFAGIYLLNFRHNDVLADTLDSIERIDFTPVDEFQKYLDNNIGYEGLAVDDNYFYLGLEGFTQGKLFADSTVLFIAEKDSHKIIKQINTGPLGIHTICGLYSDKNNSLYGVDRNNKTFFHLSFDEGLNVTDTALVKIKTNIPSYDSFDYVASIESITMDPEKNVYMIDDPWKTFFIPSNEILTQLDSQTVNRFRNFVPVIYKYSLTK